MTIEPMNERTEAALQNLISAAGRYAAAALNEHAHGAELRAALMLVQQELDDVEQDGSEIAFSPAERVIIRAALARTPAEALERRKADQAVIQAAQRLIDGTAITPIPSAVFMDGTDGGPYSEPRLSGGYWVALRDALAARDALGGVSHATSSDGDVLTNL